MLVISCGKTCNLIMNMLKLDVCYLGLVVSNSFRPPWD